MAATGADDLFSVKNNFWLGHYQAAINEGATLNFASEGVRAQRDLYTYRAYIALKNYSVVLDEVPADATGALGAVRMYAYYMSDRDANRAAAVKAAQAWMANNELASDDTVCIVAANIFNYELDYDQALRALRSGDTSLPQLAMTIHILIRMDRADLAAKKRKQMSKVDDDATITLLAGCWVSLAQGGEAGIADAVQNFSELIERFGSSVPLLNGLGAAYMQQGRFADAEKKLIDAIGMGANDPHTLINLIACAQHLDKPKEYVDRYIAQLRRVAPKHPYVVGLDSVARMFDRVQGSSEHK